MCMAPAHHWAGFATGAALATLAHQPWWVAVPSAAVASLTAGGRFSPDADQYKGWRLFDKYTPDELLGRGGPLQHRGITPVSAAGHGITRHAGSLDMSSRRA